MGKGVGGGSVACIGVALVMMIIALSSTAWTVDKYHQSGLFKACTHFNKNWKCVDTPEINETGPLLATRAFLFIGLFSGAAAGVLALLNLLINLCQNTTAVAVGGVSFVSFFCTILSVMIYAFGVYYKDEYNKLGYGHGFAFILAIVAAVLMLIGGSLFYGSSDRSESWF